MRSGGARLFIICALLLFGVTLASAADHSFIEGPINSGPEATRV